MAMPWYLARAKLIAGKVMPNHVQEIIEIFRAVVVAQHAAPQDPRVTVAGTVPSSLSTIVRSFKAEVTRRARAELNWDGEIWQRNYFDRVIRDGQEFADATRYIAENPMRWQWQKKLPSGSVPEAKSWRSMLRHYKGIGGGKELNHTQPHIHFPPVAAGRHAMLQRARTPRGSAPPPLT